MKFRCIFLILILVISLCGCGGKEATAEYFAMDTVITMTARGNNTEAALDAAADELYRLETIFSATNPTGELYTLNQNRQLAASDDLIRLVQQAVQLSEVTQGAFDCTVAPVIAAWGWYGDGPGVPAPDVLEEALAHVGTDGISVQNDGITLREGTAIDLGGIAKGYAAGRIAEILDAHEVSGGLIDLGGNIRTVGSKPDGSPWIIGIDDPAGASAYVATVSVTDCAVVTSGTKHRYFEENGQLWHHILDPKTGFPAENDLAQVTVICTDDTLADGLSTALFVMGGEQAADFWRSGVYAFDAVFIGKDGSIRITEGIQDAFESDRSYEVIRQ